MSFSIDRDLLVYEPRLFSELAWPGQIVAAGQDGCLAGAAFTSASAGFVAGGLAAGMVLTVWPAASQAGQSAQPAALEVLTVVSATQLTVSALRADPTASAIPPSVAGSGLTWQVVSFAAQAEAVAADMISHFGLSPADPTSPWTAGDIIHPEALRPVSANGVLAVVLAGAANRGDDQDGTWAKAEHYRARFERLLSQVRLGLDGGGDGDVDVVHDVAAPRLRRD